MTTQTSPTAAQEATVQAIRDHHAQLGRTVADHTVTIVRAVDQLSSPTERRDRLVAFCRQEVLPHAAAEEETLYRAAADLPSAGLLVRSMTEEHTLLKNQVDTLESARTAGEVIAAAAALDALFQAHIAKENDLLLPALTEAGVDLVSLLVGMHTILGNSAEKPGAAERPEPAGHHHCTCGGHDDPGTPGATVELTDGELDVRSLVPAQRHQQIFAAYDALRPGESFILVNDHDPKPLYYQFAAEYPGQFTWEPVESGPERWRVRIGRP